MKHYSIKSVVTLHAEKFFTNFCLIFNDYITYRDTDNGAIWETADGRKIQLITHWYRDGSVAHTIKLFINKRSRTSYLTKFENGNIDVRNGKGDVVLMSDEAGIERRNTVYKTMKAMLDF